MVDIVKQESEESKKNITSLDFTAPQVAGVEIEVNYRGTFCVVYVHPELVQENIHKFSMAPEEDLTEITYWLKRCSITSVIMPKKSGYREQIFQLLQKEGFHIYLVDNRIFANFARLWRSDKYSAFDLINPDAAGIDIGKEDHWVCIPRGRTENNVRCFKTFTCELYEIARWLKENKVTTVAMESTGVYWIPIFQILEKEGFEVFLVNARHLKNIPGRRKTDNLDCQWIQKLHSFGLLAASFRPEDQICKVRSLVRHRETIVQAKVQSIQHMQKALEQMNIKLGNVLTDIAGVSGLRIIRAILQGERDFSKIAQLKDWRAKATEEDIIKSLQGDYRSEHLFVLQQNLNQFEFYQNQMLECDKQIEKLLLEMESKLKIQTGQATFPFCGEPQLKAKKSGANAPSFDARNLFFELAGVDLIAIEGISNNTALTIISEIGLDMTKWPTEKHFVAWLRLAPNPKISGGKIIGHQKQKSNNRATQAFRMAASSLKNSKCALGAFFRRIRARSGFKKAVTATARKIAILVYFMIKDGTEYRKITEEEYLQRFRKQILKKLNRQAQRIGYQVVPQVVAQ